MMTSNPQQHSPPDEWRPGVMTRMRVSAVAGSTQLCIFEQWCDPGCGAPTHLHAVEEVLTVLDGQAEAWLGEERSPMTAGQSLFLRPASSTASATPAPPPCMCRPSSPRRYSKPRSTMRGNLAPLATRRRSEPDTHASNTRQKYDPSQGPAARPAASGKGDARPKTAKAGTASPKPSWAELRSGRLEVSDLNNAGAVLGWDQATYMPKGGAARAPARVRR